MRHLDHSFSPGARRAFTGGLRKGVVNVSWPLARLTVDCDAIRIKAPLLSTVWVQRPQVVAVRRVSGAFLVPGIRFETTDGAYDGVIFWSFSPDDVLAGLHALGSPVVARSR